MASTRAGCELPEKICVCLMAEVELPAGVAHAGSEKAPIRALKHGTRIIGASKAKHQIHVMFEEGIH